MEFVVAASVQIEVVIEAPTEELAEQYVEELAYAEVPRLDKPWEGSRRQALVSPAGQWVVSPTEHSPKPELLRWQDVDVLDVAGVDVTIDSTEQAAESGLCGPGCGAGG